MIDFNKVFIRFSKRAEKLDRNALVSTFVDLGPLQAILSTVDNQILYGRRGTGKTHALVFLSEKIKEQNDLVVFIDMRNIGSTGGIYSDQNLSLSERATRLLMDTLAAMHDCFYDIILDDVHNFNLAVFGPILDEFADAITEVSVVGEVETENTDENANKSSLSNSNTLSLTRKDISLKFETQGAEESANKTTNRYKEKGQLYHRVHFGKLSSVLQKLTNSIEERRIWLILDEWSVIPIELQPYLGDLLRRSVFSNDKITVKIGAIEKRTHFQIIRKTGDYIGIELGADASSDINLDDFMVFDNDEEKAEAFFKNLIFKHFVSISQMEKLGDIPKSPDDLINNSFSQTNVFSEFVRASEGVPRDAFYILAQAAQKNYDTKISMDGIRKASKIWYQRDKEAAVSANIEAINLLHWITDNVIGYRRSRAFLLRSNIKDQLIDNLFDSRVIHLLKRNVSAHDQPGVRYDVFKIDYGCYVDLLTTQKAPTGLLLPDDNVNIEVPADDYRAIRRAILNLEEFYQTS